MSVNDFKAFAIGKDANVLSQNEYEDLEAINEGFRSGIARSEQLNKVWRQASTIAAVVAQFMADKSGDNVVDDGDLEKLRDTLTKALLNNSTSQLDGRYLKSASNLSDVVNAATARVNLGLKGAALQDIGTVSGTVAAGNDSRIVNAAQRGNNLSDLTDKGRARANLGLGSAAVANIQTSTTDATTGALMGVGAFGIGGAEIWIPDGSDIYKYFATAKSGSYGGGNGLTNALTSGWLSFKWQQHGHEQKYGVLLEIGSSGQVAVHIYHNPNGDMSNPEKYWINSGVIYGEKKKPTASDVGALSVSGGYLTGQFITAYVPANNSAQILVKTSGDGNAIGDGQTHIGYNVGTTSAPIYNHYFRGKGSTNITTAAGCNITSNLSVGTVITAKKTITPGDYSNFDARYVQGIRVSTTVTRNFTPGGGWSPNDSAFVTAISMVGGMSNTGSLLVRYIQRNINGVWANVVA